jgi:Domain of unknown function (DUF2431).
MMMVWKYKKSATFCCGALHRFLFSFRNGVLLKSMHPDTFVAGDTVLLVGEGNFSFAVSLVELNLPLTVTASCLGSDVIKTSGDNITYLEKKGKWRS